MTFITTRTPINYPTQRS